MGLLGDLISIFSDPPKQYGRKQTTRSGTVVRSGAEARIADYLTRNRIRFKYESEIRTGIWIFTEKVSAPDFYLPDYNVYIEYWGLLDADSHSVRTKYKREMNWKMAKYHQLGIKFISLYPNNLDNLDWVFRKKFENVTGRRFN